MKSEQLYDLIAETNFKLCRYPSWCCFIHAGELDAPLCFPHYDTPIFSVAIPVRIIWIHEDDKA